jgi:hypothetical protein
LHYSRALRTHRSGEGVKTTTGKQVLYAQLKKAAFYGTLKAALLFWKRLTSVLKEWGFKVEPL